MYQLNELDKMCTHYIYLPCDAIGRGQNQRIYSPDGFGKVWVMFGQSKKFKLYQQLVLDEAGKGLNGRSGCECGWGIAYRVKGAKNQSFYAFQVWVKVEERPRCLEELDGTGQRFFFQI